MPIMDGYETIKHIRVMEGYKDIPIVAVSAKAMKKDKQKALDIGANDYITKPINLDKLVCTISKYI